MGKQAVLKQRVDGFWQTYWQNDSRQEELKKKAIKESGIGNIPDSLGLAFIINEESVLDSMKLKTDGLISDNTKTALVSYQNDTNGETIAPMDIDKMMEMISNSDSDKLFLADDGKEYGVSFSDKDTVLLGVKSGDGFDTVCEYSLEDWKVLSAQMLEQYKGARYMDNPFIDDNWKFEEEPTKIPENEKSESPDEPKNNESPGDAYDMLDDLDKNNSIPAYVELSEEESLENYGMRYRFKDYVPKNEFEAAVMDCIIREDVALSNYNKSVDDIRELLAKEKETGELNPDRDKLFSNSLVLYSEYMRANVGASQLKEINSRVNKELEWEEKHPKRSAVLNGIKNRVGMANNLRKSFMGSWRAESLKNKGIRIQPRMVVDPSLTEEELAAYKVKKEKPPMIKAIPKEISKKEYRELMSDYNRKKRHKKRMGLKRGIGRTINKTFSIMRMPSVGRFFSSFFR